MDIRLTIHPSSELPEWVPHAFPKSVWFLEGNEEGKPKYHFHAYSEDDFTMTTARNRLKQHGYKGNKDFRVSVIKKELPVYLSYISKDKNIKYTGIDIDWEEIPEWVTPAKGIEKIFEGCDTIHAHTLVTHCIDYYIKNDKPINKFRIEGLVLTYLVKHDDKYRDKLISKITDNLLK